MEFNPFVLFIICTFLQLFVLSFAQQNGTTNVSCNYKYDQVYENNSDFQKNIQKIPSILNSSAATFFFNFSIGNNPETVNVIALCRGDISDDTSDGTRCQSCLSMAYKELVGKCTKEK